MWRGAGYQETPKMRSFLGFSWPPHVGAPARRSIDFTNSSATQIRSSPGSPRARAHHQTPLRLNSCLNRPTNLQSFSAHRASGERAHIVAACIPLSFVNPRRDDRELVLSLPDLHDVQQPSVDRPAWVAQSSSLSNFLSSTFAFLLMLVVLFYRRLSFFIFVLSLERCGLFRLGTNRRHGSRRLALGLLFAFFDLVDE